MQSDIFGNFFLCGDVGRDVVFTNDTVSCASQDMYVAKISPAVSTSVSEPTAGNGCSSRIPLPSSAVGISRRKPTTQLIILRDAMGREVRRIQPTGDRVDLICSVGQQAPIWWRSRGTIGAICAGWWWLSIYRSDDVRSADVVHGTVG